MSFNPGLNTTAILADLAKKVAKPSAWATATAYTAGDFVSLSGTIYRVEANHTSGTAPTINNSAPATPGANYFVWAAAGTSPGSLVVRSSTNEATFSTVYGTTSPVADSALANKGYVDTQVAAVALAARPASPFVVEWQSSNWQYKDVTISARPSDMLAGDIILFVGNPGGSLPSWAATNDIWTQG